jgi:hypothetical protein
MKPVSEERMRLRIEYSRETDLIFSDNIPAYADWLEKRLALRQPLVMESVCSCSKGKGIDHDEDGKAYCIDCGNYLEQTVP